MPATPSSRSLSIPTLVAALAAIFVALMLAFAPGASARPCDNPNAPCDEDPGDGGGGGGGGSEFKTFEVRSSTSPAATQQNPAYDDENLTYSIEIENTDQFNTASGTKFVSEINGPAQIVSASIEGTPCSIGSKIECDLGSVGESQTRRGTIVVRPKHAGEIRNKMRAYSNTVRFGEVTELSFVKSAAAEAAFDYTMPERARDDNGDGLIDSGAPAGGYVPSSWAVDLNACYSVGGRRGIVSYTWKVAGMAEFTTASCSHRIEVPTERRYPTKLTVNLSDGSKVSADKDVRVQDRLVVMMGDSYASGEGAPHTPIRYGSSTVLAPPTWDDVRCHRSMFAGSARAARILEQQDPRSSVTYLSRACSGGTILQGIIGSYPGIEPIGDTMLPPQVDQVEALVGKGKIDDLLISIGGNDVGFAPILADCLKPGFDCYKNTGNVNKFHSDIAALKEQRYPDLRAAIESKLKPDTTYLTEYPDFTTAGNGVRCGTNYPFGEGKIGEDILVAADMNNEEADWASQTVLPIINGAVQDGVDRSKQAGLDWRYVGGIVNQWTGPGFGHGYCTGNPKQRVENRWVNTFTDSCDLQGPPKDFILGVYHCDPLAAPATTGHFHPNERGYMAQANSYLAAMEGNPPRIDETTPGEPGDGGGEPGDGGGDPGDGDHPGDPGDPGDDGGEPGDPGDPSDPGDNPGDSDDNPDTGNPGNPNSGNPGNTSGGNTTNTTTNNNTTTTNGGGGTTNQVRTPSSVTPPRKAGKCSKLKGRKRAKCVKKACGRYQVGRASKRKKVKYVTCKRAAMRKR